MTVSSFSVKAEIYEIVSFTYKPDVSFEVQKKSTESLNEIVSKFKGFKSRSFYYSEENKRWFDLITWESSEDAKRGTEQALKNPKALEVFGLMDEKSMIFSHYEKLGETASN